METPLQEAKGLSKQLGSKVLLKREDLQVRLGAGVLALVHHLFPGPCRCASTVRVAPSRAPFVSSHVPPAPAPAPSAPPRPGAQPVRSFKVRGAYNKMSRLPPDQLAKGVICSSAGNHAQVGGGGARGPGGAASCQPLC